MSIQGQLDKIHFIVTVTFFAVCTLHGYHLWVAFKEGMRKGLGDSVIRDRLSLARKIHLNRSVYDPATQVLTVYDDDGVTILREFPINE